VSPAGEDESRFKAVGGRIGIRDARGKFKGGISGTYDRDQRRDTSVATFFPDFFARLAPLGDVPRARLGADLSFTLGRFAFEGEYIGVFHDARYPANSTASLNKQFYYLNALYNITDEFFVYGQYNFISSTQTERSSADAAGFQVFAGGAGYRFNDNFALKAQVYRFQAGANAFVEYSDTIYLLGISVLF
jgi:predicted porin